MKVVEEAEAGWDFFVSYTQADRAWAEWIAWQLEEAGYRVLVQAWDFVPGTNWVQQMDQGVARSTRTIAVLSEAYLHSVYGRAEWQAAWANDPRAEGRKLLVARVTDCTRPGLLSGVVGVDLFGKPEGETKARLRRMIATAVEGAGKPERAPFPVGRAIPRGARFPGALPGVWSAPPRNPNFTGREGDLHSLTSDLAAARTVTVLSILGMGGIGKTQLATEFAHVRAGDYDVVWWIAAEEPALISEQMARLARALGFDPGIGDPDAIREAAHAGLAQAAGWLLIFDNAESTDIIRYWLPSAPMPPGIPGHVVVTTRQQGFDALGTVIELELMSTAESVELLRARIPAIDLAVAEALADELDRLPLALEQAAGYINKTKIPALNYLILVRTRTSDMISRGSVPGRDVTIATLWDLSLQQLTNTSPAAAELLELCAYMAPVPIPLNLFRNNPGNLPPALAEAAADELAFTDVIEAVVEYSLAKRSPSGLLMHRLSQAAIRSRAARSHSLGRSVGLLESVLRLLRTDHPKGSPSKLANWPRLYLLFPHILAATQLARDENYSSHLKGVALSDCSWLLDRAGTFLQSQGRYRDASRLMAEAVRLDEELLGQNSPLIAFPLSNLAMVLKDLGEPEEARPLLERALALTEGDLGPDHPDVAVRLSNLASVLQDLGEPGGARPLAERALAISEAQLGPDHPHVASRLSNLAMVLLDLGQPAAARPLLERALAIGEAQLGPNHPAVAIRLSNLAVVLQDLGEPAAARPLLERALAIGVAQLGPNHPAIATSLGNLALAMRDVGEAPAALPLLERALQLDERLLGLQHPAVARDSYNLAVCYIDVGDYTAARPLLEQALSTMESSLGMAHPTSRQIRLTLNDLSIANGVEDSTSPTSGPRTTKDAL